MRSRCQSTGTAVLLSTPRAFSERSCLKHPTCLAAARQALSICVKCWQCNIHCPLPQGRPIWGVLQAYPVTSASALRKVLLQSVARCAVARQYDIQGPVPLPHERHVQQGRAVRVQPRLCGHAFPDLPLLPCWLLCVWRPVPVRPCALDSYITTLLAMPVLSCLLGVSTERCCFLTYRQRLF